MDTLQEPVSTMRGTLAKASQKLDILMFILGIIRQYCPNQLRNFLLEHAQRLISLVDPYIEISIHQNSGSLFKGSSTYAAVEAYLSKISSKTAKKLKAETGFGSQKILIKLDEQEQVTDVFQGVKVWWSFSKTSLPPQPQRSLFSTHHEPEKRFYKVKFHRKYRELITGSYLGYVVEKGKEAQLSNRQRKLYTNCGSSGYSYHSMWTSIHFQHPATFETLAMDPKKKEEIMEDLVTFSRSKEYYAEIGKAWKRGYLLYGPPGTGKSTMIAAMANLLCYDVYDLELTAVKDNTELRKLLIDTKTRSIIVIEDIDCSLHLTGDRKTDTDNKTEKGANEKETTEKQTTKAAVAGTSTGTSKVTLSGLLNFIDGIWSASGGERIIVFTTNYLDKLDPALIRRGRMDKHIQLSHCSFEGFKVLAKNYLKMETHCLFETVEELLKEVKITPADVAENLMPRSSGEDADKRLSNFVQALEALKKATIAKEDKEEVVKEKIATSSKEDKEEIVKETYDIAKDQ